MLGFRYILWGIRIYCNKTLGLRYFVIFWLRTKEVKWRKKFTLDENLFTQAKFWVAVFKHVTHFRSTGFISDQIKNGTIIHIMCYIHFRPFRLLYMTLCCIPCISIHWHEFSYILDKYIRYSYRTLKMQSNALTRLVRQIIWGYKLKSHFVKNTNGVELLLYSCSSILEKGFSCV